MPIVASGFITGLLLQIAIGPVFLLILSITLQRSLVDGFLAVIAVTIADYIYILLAIFGVGKLLEKPRIKSILGICSSIIIVLFGIMMIISARSPANRAIVGTNSSNYIASFLSAFGLTISSPLTIVFWTSIFASRALEKGYNKNQVLLFGLSAGMATVFFLGLSVILFSFLRTSLPLAVLAILNISVGILLIAYGVFRLTKSIKKSDRTSIEQTKDMKRT